MSTLHKTIVRLLFTVSSIVTIYSYIETNFTKTNVSVAKITFSVLVVMFLIAALVIDVAELIISFRKKFRIDGENFHKNINKYMRNWIKQGGRTVIATRDMSWANTSQTKNLLLDKARRRELVICLPENISLSDELRNAGAEIYTYPNLGYVLKSRFTIIRLGQAGSQVAVGMALGSQHVVEEYQEGWHPCYAIANDLVEVIMRISRGAVNNTSKPGRPSPRKRK